jgi:hypothetical protein
LVFDGVGISDRRSVPAAIVGPAAVVVACDTVVVSTLVGVPLLVVEVPECGEPLHAVASNPTAAATT